MVEPITIASSAGVWVTAMAIDSLSGYFTQALVDRGMDKWAANLRHWTSSAELEAIRELFVWRERDYEILGAHQDLNVGMGALSASINALNREQEEGTAAVLRQLVELRVSQHRDEQLACLKKATDAMNDLRNGRHKSSGHPKNVGLLEKAYKNAEDAARVSHGTLSNKLQAYRIWIVAAYWHEVTTNKTCRDAKDEAMFILGHVILNDADLLQICDSYSAPRAISIENHRPEMTAPVPAAEEEWTWTGNLPGGHGCSSEETSKVILFLIEIMSSVCMLPPLDQDVSCPGVIKVVGAGMKVVKHGHMEMMGGEIVLGPNAPKSVTMAMGRYCAGHRGVAQLYPTVSAMVLKAWEKGKERLAVDNLFIGMGGENWLVNAGWTDKEGELCNRFGIAVEDGHVTKICLAANNLQGMLDNDLADCEHLRELVLHGNDITQVIPPRMESLILSKPDMIVTGLPREELGESPPIPPDMPVFLQTPSRSRPSSYIRRGPGGAPGPYPVTPGFSTEASFAGTDGTDSSSVRSSFRTRGRKKSSKRSGLKGALTFLREAAGADFSVGYALKCNVCDGPLRYKKDKSVECPACLEGV